MSKQGKTFYFKKFAIEQQHSTHKVGTDGVLLGAWVDVAKAEHILDIGTGTGLIALMLAQRTGDKTQIDAIEINAVDAEQAKQNVLQSPWPDKVSVLNIDATLYESEKKYDLIVSNPPFFINSTLPPREQRGNARHTHSLSFEDLISKSAKLLESDGKLAVILPPVEAEQFITLASSFGLACIRECAFYSRKNKPLERLLLEFSFNKEILQKTSLTLYESESWSDDYCNLTKDFYLKI